MPPNGASVPACVRRPPKDSKDKDALLGRLFGLAALLRSGLPLSPAAAAGGKGAGGSGGLAAGLVNAVLEAGGRKSFLREAAAAVVVEAAGRLSSADVAAALAAPGSALAALLLAPPSEATPEVRLRAAPPAQGLWEVSACVAVVGALAARVGARPLHAGPRHQRPRGSTGVRAAPPTPYAPQALLLALVLWPKLPASALAACRLLPAGVPPPPEGLLAIGPGPGASAAAAAATTAAGFFTQPHLQASEPGSAALRPSPQPPACKATRAVAPARTEPARLTAPRAVASPAPQALLPVLLATSSAHPRLHSLWQHLLPLLLPGFRPRRVAGAGPGAALAAEGADAHATRARETGSWAFEAAPQGEGLAGPCVEQCALGLSGSCAL
jgi:hypothetical protein